MASVAFIFGSASLTTTLSDIGSAVPSGEDWSMEAVRAANIHATSTANVDVVLTDGTSVFYIARNVPVPPGRAEDILPNGRLKLPTGWKVQARSSANSVLCLTVSGVKRSAA